MTKLLEVFIESFRLLFKNPKMFIPKIIMAAIHGILMLLAASFVLDGIDIIYSQNLEKAMPLLFYSLTLLIITFIVFVLDILISAMYSVLVKDFYRKEKIQLLKSLKAANKKAFIVVPAVIIYTLIFLVLTLPLTLLISVFLISKNLLYVLISFALTVLIYFSDLLFFLIYPVSIYEKVNPFSAIKRTIKLSRENLKDISKASFVPFSISLISWALAFFQEYMNFC